MMRMWRKKKFILIGLLVVVVFGATLGGIAIAQANDQSNTTSQFSTLLDKVASIYQQNTGIAIDSQELAKAFTQAQKEMRDSALDTYLSNLVAKGKITQDQANQFKTWSNSRPDVPIGPGFRGGFHGMGNFGGWFGGKNAPNTGSGTSTQ
jgi:hypothetical protein